MISGIASGFIGSGMPMWTMLPRYAFCILKELTDTAHLCLQIARVNESYTGVGDYFKMDFFYYFQASKSLSKID